MAARFPGPTSSATASHDANENVSGDDETKRSFSLLADVNLESSNDDLEESRSFTFKRKYAQQPPSASGFGLAGLFSPPRDSGDYGRNQTSSPHVPRRARSKFQTAYSPGLVEDGEELTPMRAPTGNNDAARDLQIEGPGRRLGYDDFTTIDWIYEYSKERQRVRHLFSIRDGIWAYFRPWFDSSHAWIILIASGVLVGLLAACIDIAGDWLGDIKTGYCRNSSGRSGYFTLNKTFCCWGYDDISKCSNWVPWRDAFAISKAGGYALEYMFYIIYSILFACVASVLVRVYAPYAKHSGIPEIKSILGGLVISNFMSAWTLLIKSLGLCLAVASGLWLGKEGPLVHVACCCAQFVMRPFQSINQNEARKREIISAAAASGISVAFGSPIGGVLFSLEQVAYYFPLKTMWQSFVCAMVAAVTLHAINPFRTGKIVLYQVTYTRGWHSFEVLPFIALGIFGGLYGAFFIKLNMKVARWRKSSSILPSPVVQVALVALASSVINFPNIFMRAQLSELVHYLFSQCSDSPDDPFRLCKTGAASWPTVMLLLSAVILGFFLSAVTFGLDIPAGIILPSLAIGALYGRALGIVIEMWQAAHPNSFIFNSCEPDVPCITPGIYAIIGAASALGGATRMTISIVVIMFELTGALTYVIPIMISVMVAKWCGDIFGKRSIYECWIHLKDYPFLQQTDDTSVPDISVNSVMTKFSDLSVITATGQTVGSLKELLDTSPYRGYPVILDVSEPLLLGYIARNELAFALQSSPSTNSQTTNSSPIPPISPETTVYFAHQPFSDPRGSLDLRPWMNQTPVTMNSLARFPIVLQMFQRLGLRYILLVDQGMLEGFLTRKDMWHILSGDDDDGDDDNFVEPGHDTYDDGDDDGNEEGRRLLSRSGDDGDDVESMFSPLADRREARLWD